MEATNTTLSLVRGIAWPLRVGEIWGQVFFLTKMVEGELYSAPLRQTKTIVKDKKGDIYEAS